MIYQFTMTEEQIGLLSLLISKTPVKLVEEALEELDLSFSHFSELYKGIKAAEIGAPISISSQIYFKEGDKVRIKSYHLGRIERGELRGRA